MLKTQENSSFVIEISSQHSFEAIQSLYSIPPEEFSFRTYMEDIPFSNEKIDVFQLMHGAVVIGGISREDMHEYEPDIARKLESGKAKVHKLDRSRYCAEIEVFIKDDNK